MPIINTCSDTQVSKKVTQDEVEACVLLIVKSVIRGTVLEEIVLI